MLLSASDHPILTIRHNGEPLDYVDVGRGPVLLLIHGSLCDLRYWRWQIPAFSDHFRVIAPSLRGYWPHAFAEPSSLFTVSQHAADMAYLLDEASALEPVHLLGHSRGARVAMELALLLPERIASITLADPALPSAPGESDAQLYASVAEKLTAGDLEGALGDFVDSVNGADTWRRMTPWFKQMVKDNAGTLLSQSAEPEQTFDLARATVLTCPALLLGGELSPPRYAKAIDVLRNVLPQAEHDVIPKAAHGMNLGNAPAFNQRLLRFLTEQA